MLINSTFLLKNDKPNKTLYLLSLTKDLPVKFKMKNHSPESVLLIKLEFFDAFNDIIKCTMTSFFLIKQFWQFIIDDNFNGRDIQNSVMQKVVQSFHMMKHEQFVHVNRVAFVMT